MESYEEVQKFERPATGSGSRPASSGGLSPEHNLLKILFTDLKETTKVQNELSEKNLSLMHLYWDNTGEVSNFADFEARYCLDKGLMSTKEAKEIYNKLEDDFQATVQGALDRIYDACYGSMQTKQSKERLALVKNMKIDELGMVSQMEAMTVFAKIHFNDRTLLLKVNEVYQEVFEEELQMRHLRMMF